MCSARKKEEAGERAVPNEVVFATVQKRCRKSFKHTSLHHPFDLITYRPPIPRTEESMGRLLEESDVRARLRRGAEGVLTHAVDSRELGTDGHAAVHRSLRSLCRAARSHGIQVEQLVVICKDAWRTLPAAPQIGRAHV